MSTRLTVRTKHNPDGGLVVYAAGEIDASNVADFAKALACTNGGTLTVDLSAVEYLDSAGINALVPHTDALHVIANPLLLRVLRVSGLDELATVEPAPPSSS